MLERIRNIGIIAHVDAGKTTTTERVLFYGGSKHTSGDVDDGNTTTDFDEQEQKRGVTIYSAAVTVTWRDHQVAIIDTPGHVDFTAEVERSLRVLDGACGVFCAVGGVQVQSETVWFQANKYGVPRIAFINKMDRMGADFDGCIAQMKEKLGVVPAICVMPCGASDEFEGVADVIRMKFWKNDPNDPKHERYTWEEIPEQYQAKAEHYREMLLDAVSHVDDDLMEKILEGEDLKEEEIRAAIRKGTLDGKITPIFCGTAKMYHGVRLMMDGVIDYLPSPSERPPVEGTHPKTKEAAMRKPEPEEPMSALAFKTVAEKHGDLVFLRIYSGELRPGEVIMNSTAGKKERISHIYRLMGDHRERLEVAGPGEIVAVVGLKHTITGATLCSDSEPVVLEQIRFPDPVISQSLIPGKRTDEGKLADAIARMVRDDPTLKCFTNHETDERIISGMGELHLEVAIHKLKRDYGLEVEVGKPMVAYRQTLSKPVEFETRFVKQSGGRGKFAVIVMRYEPLNKEALEERLLEAEEKGQKIDPNNLFFNEEIFGGTVPREYIPSVEQGFREACVKGAKYGFQCVDIAATLLDGKAHEVDSSQDAFKLAGKEATRDAQVKAGITLLEPIMNLMVTAPGQYHGDLIRDVSRRRGEILDSKLDSDAGGAEGRCEIHAYVPLAELFGYMNDLRNFTSGTAAFTMEPSHYAPVNEELADVRAAS